MRPANTALFRSSVPGSPQLGAPPRRARRRGLTAAAQLLIPGLVLIGCTGGPPPTGTPTPSATTATAEPSPSEEVPADPDAPLDAYEPSNDEVLGSLSDQTGMGSIELAASDADTISIYLDCRGSGKVTVSIPDVAEFPLDCDTSVEGAQVRHDIDVGDTDSPQLISVHAADDQTWTLTVAATTATESTPSAGTEGPGSQSRLSDLDRRINGIIDEHTSHTIGVALIDNRDGSLHRYGSEDRFVAASTAKIITAAAFYAAVENGQMSVEEPVGGLPGDTQVRSMIQQSDNASWLMLINALGRERITRYAETLGIRYEPDRNTLAPEDSAKLLEKLHNGDLLSAAHTDELLGFMQNTNNDTLIPAAVPAGVDVHHKYGLLGGVLHDVAILEGADDDYSISIYTSQADDDADSSSVDVIHQITAAVTGALL